MAPNSCTLQRSKNLSSFTEETCPLALLTLSFKEMAAQCCQNSSCCDPAGSRLRHFRDFSVYPKFPRTRFHSFMWSQRPWGQAVFCSWTYHFCLTSKASEGPSHLLLWLVWPTLNGDYQARESSACIVKHSDRKSRLLPFAKASPLAESSVKDLCCFQCPESNLLGLPASLLVEVFSLASSSIPILIYVFWQIYYGYVNC